MTTNEHTTAESKDVPTTLDNGPGFARHARAVLDREYTSNDDELTALRDLAEGLLAEDDALRTALTKLADLCDAQPGPYARILHTVELRDLLAAHPAPEVQAQARICPTCHDDHMAHQPCAAAPVSDTRREDVEAGAEAAWRTSQEVNGFAEDSWAEVSEPQRQSWRYIARAVLAVLPAPPVADEVEIRNILHDAECPDRCEPQAMGRYVRMAAAVAARLRGATR